MTTTLADTTALVTGATSGIGRACAERLLRDGARVVAVGRRGDRLTALAERLGPRLHPLPLDVTDRAAVEAALASLPGAFGAFDLLVNSAGMALGLEPVHRTSLEDWDRMIETNCRALVTGASSGIGLACAERFIQDGATVVAVARRADRLRALADRLGPRLLPVALDVTDGAAVTRALTGPQAPVPPIDLLVNAAGLALGLEPVHRTSMEDWDRMIETNCRALVFVTRLVLPGMVERGRGHVVNIGSVAGSYPYPGGNVYGATKAFVRQFSLAIRSDLLGTPVRVTSVEPGMCDTEFSTVRFAGDREKAGKVYAGMRPLRAADVADTVAWCVTRPAHVNVNSIELMPVQQAFGPFAVHRDPGT
jgi:3-hydroxy acid dehydrogenase/malonic semialdehyde reductase